MDRYGNYNGDTFSNNDPDNPNYNISEYPPQEYEGNDYSEYTYDTMEYANTNSTDYEQDDWKYTNADYDEYTYHATEYASSNPTEPEYASDTIQSNLYSDKFVETATTLDNINANELVEEELTPAEIADYKRQREVERRKKLAAKARRRKKRKQQAIIRCSILLVIIIVLIIGLVKLISGIRNHIEEEKKAKELSDFLATSEVTTEEPVADIDESIIAKEIPTDRQTALEVLKKEAETDTDIQSIYDNSATLPDVLLLHLAANTELKDFAIKYPAKINIVFDGNFTVDIENSEIPLYFQYDERWGYADYSTDLIGLNGAGPTVLSMACTYFKQDGRMNPIKIADYATEKGYLDEAGKTHWSLMTEGATLLGLTSKELENDKEDMIKALEDGKLIICQMSAGDFTTDEHYILIRDYKDGFFYLNDPSSAARSEVGWDYKRLSKQINNICTLEDNPDAAQNDDAQDNTQADDNQTDDDQSDTNQNDDTPTENDSDETGETN